MNKNTLSGLTPLFFNLAIANIALNHLTKPLYLFSNPKKSKKSEGWYNKRFDEL